jgi:hypothetical protein
MTFGEALEQMEKGRVVARRSWPCHALNFGIAKREFQGEPCVHSVANGSWGHAHWYPGQRDMFANDWEVIEAGVPS